METATPLKHVQQLRNIHKNALLDDTMWFWRQHSVDYEHGRFFAYYSRQWAIDHARRARLQEAARGGRT